jgi:hypothetical protein
MSEAATEKMWQATLKNTRDVLGGEPDRFSAAKVTFTLPETAWEFAQSLC